MTASSTKKRAVVVCPGRGTYNKDELGYFHRYHADKMRLLDTVDTYRAQQQQIAIADLDKAEAYNMRLHTAGENASALIYACALGDFLSIDQDEYEIVAVTGNSMGWYIALAVAQAVNETNAIHLINTMGSMMRNGVIGGQIIYPLVDDNWCWDSEREAMLTEIVADLNTQDGVEIYTSIKLGGFMVYGANQAGLIALEKALPPLDDRYPMKLFNHAAFHTPLLKGISEKALQQLPASLFQTPSLPLIDGRGHIWQPYATNTAKLHDYTLAHQVYEHYDYTAAIQVAVKEFAPDNLIILGPGSTLGGATAQSLIQLDWQNMSSKTDFINRQKSEPFVIAMGMEDQRKLVDKLLRSK